MPVLDTLPPAAEQLVANPVPSTIYGAANVCVLTSRNEGTPVAVIEALAAGVPAVSTDVGGVRDVLNDPVLGATAPDGDVNGLAVQVLRALSPEVFEAAAGAAATAIDPLEDINTNAEYRRDLIHAMTRRALDRAAA